MKRKTNNRVSFYSFYFEDEMKKKMKIRLLIKQESQQSSTHDHTRTSRTRRETKYNDNYVGISSEY